MKARTENIIVLAIFTICFLALICVSVIFGGKSNDMMFTIIVHNKTEMEKISVWHNSDGKYYCFLPSYADLDSLSVDVSVALDGVTYPSGESLKIELNREYQLKFNGATNLIEFIQSANTAALYINTAKHDLSYIHASKDNKEKINMMLIDENGEVDYEQAHYKSVMKGRGNSSWSGEKRPYNIELNEASRLLGMGKAQKWALIASAGDTTQMKNKIVYDYAGRVGFPWTPQGRYTDVYINGEYRGLYLLMEKIEISETRLDIEPENYLFDLDYQYRVDYLNNGFITDQGQTVEIANPKICSDSEQMTLKNHLDDFESALYSGNKTYLDYIDLDTWARKYLIEELFANTDAGFASQYFYWNPNEDSGKIYAGPVWDYDGTMGALALPKSFMANREYKREGMFHRWYCTLYQQEEFYNKVVELYRTEFQPLIEEYLSSEIPDLSREISKAANSDSIRWLNTSYQCEEQLSLIIDYMRERIDWLNDVWLNGSTYYTVRISSKRSADDTASIYWYYEARPNENIAGILNKISEPYKTQTEWINEDNGQAFDVNTPITAPVNLKFKSADLPSEPPQFTIFEKLQHNASLLASIGVFGGMCLMIVVLIVIDLKRNKGKG